MCVSGLGLGLGFVLRLSLSTSNGAMEETEASETTFFSPSRTWEFRSGHNLRRCGLCAALATWPLPAVGEAEFKS